MKKQDNIISWAVEHSSIVLLIALSGIIFGIYSLVVMPKQEFPAFTIRQGMVIGVYPGATSEEIDAQLTRPLEAFIFEFQEVNKEKTTSQSRDGMVFVTVELNGDVKDKDAFWAKFKHRLNQFKSELPAGVLAVIANDDFGDTSALLVAVESEDKTYRELEDYVDELKRRLRHVESISNLKTFGTQEEQISVYLDMDKLASYSINENTLALNLLTQGFTTSSGSVDNEESVVPIHISSSYNSEREVAEQIVYSDPQGNVIRLKDVARVVREYPVPDTYITNNGKKSLLLSMEMVQGYNIVEMGKEVNGIIKQFQEDLPDDVGICSITDQSQVVGDSITTFLTELLIAICAVIVVVLLLLPLRAAAVAASTIPMTIFLALGIFFACGIELNTVTLAALIVTLGMIVDNSIVIIDCYMEKLDRGMSRRQATIESAGEFFKSILSATLAISITFFPFLLTTTGTINDFLQTFPWAITIILFLSLMVAVLIIPYMQEFFIPYGFNREGAAKKTGMLNGIQNGYERILRHCFAHPWITVGVGVVSILAGVSVFFSQPMRIMPIAERNQFAVEIYLPQGSSIERTACIADSLEQILQKDSRVVSITKFMGQGSPRFHASYAPQLPGPNYAQFIVNTTGNKSTVEMLDEYSDRYHDFFADARIRFKQMEYNIVAYPIEIRLRGENAEDLKCEAEKIRQLMMEIEGIKLPHTNFENQLQGVQLKLKEDEISRLGISRASVSANLAMHAGGLPVTTVWEGDYPVKVVLLCNGNNEQDINSLANEYISAWGGSVSVPLRQIAEMAPDWHDGQIVRRNGELALSVLADVDRGYNVTNLTRELLKRMEQIDLSDNVEWEVGGGQESDAETLPQIITGLICAIVIIFFILLFHFSSIKMALLILGSTLFSVLGAGIGLWIMKVDLSMTAILGIISLMGIIVRNGIIMLDYAEELRRENGLSVFDAAYHAAGRRMRPIFLTSLAASMGVIPMILGKSALWSPMGTVIFFGTLVSMLFTITVLPVVYWIFYRKQDRQNLNTVTII